MEIFPLVLLLHINFIRMITVPLSSTVAPIWSPRCLLSAAICNLAETPSSHIAIMSITPQHLLFPLRVSVQGKITHLPALSTARSTSFLSKSFYPSHTPRLSRLSNL
jgi:hypothetical protein